MNNESLSEGKCPKCGADLNIEDDLMFMKQWECTNPECDYAGDDW